MNHEETKENESHKSQLPADENGTQPESGTPPLPEQEHFPEDPEAPANDPQTLLAEEKDRYLRLYSEFENFRRRTSREKLEMMQTAGKDIIVSLLGIVDDFERALSASAGMEPVNVKSLEGFELIYRKMLQTLESRGVKAIESKGQPFDVEYHEAVTRFPAPTEQDKGKVIDELEKGYTMNGHVIRFAKVVVGE